MEERGIEDAEFSVGIRNDDFPNDTFESEEAQIDDDDIYVGSGDGHKNVEE